MRKLVLPKNCWMMSKERTGTGLVPQSHFPDMWRNSKQLILRIGMFGTMQISAIYFSSLNRWTFHLAVQFKVSFHLSQIGFCPESQFHGSNVQHKHCQWINQVLDTEYFRSFQGSFFGQFWSGSRKGSLFVTKNAKGSFFVIMSNYRGSSWRRRSSRSIEQLYLLRTWCFRKCSKLLEIIRFIAILHTFCVADMNIMTFAVHKFKKIK